MDFIKKLKTLLFEENVNQDFADYKTEDGRIIRTEALAEGNEIKEINEAGEVIDLEDGEYTIQDENLKIVVAGSKIESTEEIAVEEEEEMETEEDFIDSKLEDGTSVKVDKLEVGGKVEVIDEEGNVSPAPEGEHILEDGTKLVVDADGIITEVVVPEVEETEEEMSEEESFETKVENWFNSKMETEEVKSIFEAITKYVNQNEELISKFEALEKENKELKEKFQKFSSEDSVESLSTKVEFTEMTKEDKLKFLSKGRK